MISSPTGPLALGKVRRAYDAAAEELAAYFPDTRAEDALDLAVVDAFARDVTASGDGARVLDAGCGAGRMSRYLTTRGCLVEGVDLSPRMIELARRDSGDLVFTVGSLTDLPYATQSFAGVLLWYSIIHTPPDGLPEVFAEAARVLRPGGCLLVGFQSGEGVRQVAWSYLESGRRVHLERHRYLTDQIADHLRAAGLREQCRLVRRALRDERDDQAFLFATRA